MSAHVQIEEAETAEAGVIMMLIGAVTDHLNVRLLLIGCNSRICGKEVREGRRDGGNKRDIERDVAGRHSERRLSQGTFSSEALLQMRFDAVLVCQV